jgi:hypothetical protein
MNRKPSSVLTAVLPPSADGEPPFALPEEAFESAYLETAALVGDGGEEAVRQHFDQVFRQYHAQWQSVATAMILEEKRPRERLLGVLQRLCHRIQELPATRQRPLPPGEAAYGRSVPAAIGWGCAAVILASLTLFNIARFAANVTQSWPWALAFAAPFVFVGLTAKRYVEERAAAGAPSRTPTSLKLLFAASFALFALSFTQGFGYTPSAEAIVRDPSLADRASDLRLLLLSQVILEPLLSLAAFCAFRDALRRDTSEVPNPDCEILAKEAARLEIGVRSHSLSIGQYEGLLLQFEAARQVFVEQAVSRWRELQRLREEAERDKEEADRIYQAQQTRLAQRQQVRQERLATLRNHRNGSGQEQQKTIKLK